MTAVAEHAVTAGPLSDAKSQLADAIAVLGYEEGIFALLSTPRRETTVSIPSRRDDGEIELLIGHRVQASVIVEAANGSTTPGADAVFGANGQLGVPDI